MSEEPSGKAEARAKGTEFTFTGAARCALQAGSSGPAGGVSPVSVCLNAGSISS